MSQGALILITSLSMGLMLWLILRWKLHPFLALLAAAMALGLLAGMRPEALLASIQKGMAELLGSIALIIGAGAVMGRMIEVSGGGRELAVKLIHIFGRVRIPWALLLASYLVGIPMFLDAAFFTLIPLVWSIARETKKSLLVYALPLLAALTATHGLIPLHPGPAAAAQLLGADLGRTTLYGLILGIPMAVAGGIVYCGWIGRRIFVPVPDSLAKPPQQTKTGWPPGLTAVATVILLPIVLIALATWMPDAGWINFLGSPSIALLAAAIAALLVLGRRSGLTAAALAAHTAESLNAIGSLMLIIAAAGAFKQVIVDCGAGPQLAQSLARSRMPALLLGFLVGAAIRVTIGSATASIITAAGILAPLLSSMPGVDPVLMVAAVATGGSAISHVNDAGFWMVKEYCGMTVPQTLRSYSVMKAVTATTGFACVYVFDLITHNS